MVLSTSVAMPDLDRDHILHWIELAVPPTVLADPRWAVVIVESGRPGTSPTLLKTVVRGKGDVPIAGLTLPDMSDKSLAALKTQLGANFLVVLESGIAGEVIGAVEREIDPRASMTEQALVWLRVLKQYDGKGLGTSPAILPLLPAPPIDALTKSFDLLIPDKSTLVAYVFENDGSGVFASVIARKRRGEIDLVTTHLALEHELSAKSLARDPARHRERLCQLIADRFDRVAVGVFLDRATFERILIGPPDQLARELNNKKLIIDPAPTWLLGLLGGATMAAVASRGARALAGFLPKSARKMATDFASVAQDTLKERGAHPFALLGFDPIALWMSLREFYRPRPRV